MSGINFMGSYSGIDKSMIDQIMQAEKLPLNQLTSKKTDITEKQNAWRDINTRLNSLFEKIKVLQNPDTFISNKADSTNDKIITMSPGKGAVSGKYRINVNQLATSSSIVGNKVLAAGQKTTDALEIQGTFKIRNVDGEEIEIDVTSGHSLKDVVDNINEALYTKEGESQGKSIGISASIIDGRIVLSDEKTGARDIVVEGDTVVGTLGLDNKMDLGNQAIFTINGVSITKDSNSVKDVLDGVTINLHSAHSGDEYDTVTIGLDIDNTSKAIQEFVEQYNSTMKFIEEKMAAGDPDKSGSRGILAGDGSLMRLHSSLRQMVTSSLGDTNTSIKDISRIGVSTTDRYGMLQFDSSKLRDALLEDADNVKNFFSSKTHEDKEIGFTSRINGYINSFISKENGTIKSKNESYDRTIKSLGRQIEDFADRMERKEQYYIKMFAALDVAMMQAESQMTWLQGQVDSMNGIKR